MWGWLNLTGRQKTAAARMSEKGDKDVTPVYSDTQRTSSRAQSSMKHVTDPEKAALQGLPHSQDASVPSSTYVERLLQSLSRGTPFTRIFKGFKGIRIWRPLIRRRSRGTASKARTRKTLGHGQAGRHEGQRRHQRNMHEKMVEAAATSGKRRPYDEPLPSRYPPNSLRNSSVRPPIKYDHLLTRNAASGLGTAP